MGKQNTAKPSRNYVNFRRRVRMVSVATLRTFEIDLSDSLTCWISRVKPNENVVLSLTIYKSVFVGLLRIPLD